MQKVPLIGLIIDDLQSKLLVRLFETPELKNALRVTVFDLEVLKRSFMIRLQISLSVRLGRPPEEAALTAVSRRLRRVSQRLELNHVIGLDNKLPLLARIAESKSRRLPKCSIIQLGTNPKYYDVESRCHARSVPICMYSWGSRETTQYSRVGLYPETFVTVGSLKSELARRKNQTQGEPKTWDLCIVSQFRSAEGEVEGQSASNKAEIASMPALVALLRPVIIKHQLRTVVALKSGKSLLNPWMEREERSFFSTALGDIAEIMPSEDYYENYRLVKSSRLAVGRNSGLLFEALGSGTRVLFVNPTEFALFNAPPGIPYSLRMPSEAQLEKAILSLLEMNDSDYSWHVKESVERFCITNESSIAILAQMLNEVTES